jgi:hypothetical protein
MRFLGRAILWISTDQRALVVLVKFAIVLTGILGSLIGLLALGTWIGGVWLGIALMASPIVIPALSRRRWAARVQVPKARSLPPRRAN